MKHSLDRHSVTMGTVREVDVINTVRDSIKDRSKGRVKVGIGDDAAVIDLGGALSVITTDTLTEGTHFRTEYCSFRDIGYRAAATATSDIAAMGADAGELYVAVVLPSGFRESDLREIYQGIEELAALVDATVAGGETVAGRSLTLTVTVVGYIVQGQKPVLRSGARPLDLIGVTGPLGSATAGRMLLENCSAMCTGNQDEEITKSYLRPEPRIEFGKQLAALGATAMIDISDGLAKDAAQLATASELEFSIDIASLPITERVREIAIKVGKDSAIFAATGGDDYELCFCASPDIKQQCESLLPVTWIGSVKQGVHEVIFERDGVRYDLDGYEHFF